MTRKRSLVVNLRNGALLAPLSAVPMLVGPVWEVAGGNSRIKNVNPN